MKTRVATEAEAAAIFPKQEGIELWVVILEGEEGHLCLSRSPMGVFGHNTTFETPQGALALWRAARRQLGEWGVTEYFVHIEIGTPQRVAEFWQKRCEAVFVCLRGEIVPKESPRDDAAQDARQEEILADSEEV